jgi:beta-phosphoglucomutase
MVDAFIFDVDGVIVDSPHERAWGEALRDLMAVEWRNLRAAVRYSPELYTSDVYRLYVAGRPRADGAAALLAYFGIDDPHGARAALLCERKQRLIERLIERGEFRAYDDALRFLAAAKDCGAKLAAASSSKNANALLAGLDLLRLFDANVCGRDFAHGKPHPDIFLAAAEALGVEPDRCVVIEDAPNGVAAAKAGGMRCIGVARGEDAELLASAGADWVVGTLDDVDPADL